MSVTISVSFDDVYQLSVTVTMPFGVTIEFSPENPTDGFSVTPGRVIFDGGCCNGAASFEWTADSFSAYVDKSGDGEGGSLHVNIPADQIATNMADFCEDWLCAVQEWQGAQSDDDE